MRYLVATDSVHTTAAACDYLDPRLEDDDFVSVVSVPGANERDAEDALNVVTARLAGRADITTEQFLTDGDPANGILSAANNADIDVIVIGPHAGDPDSGPELGGTARRIIEGANVPVVVVPLSI